MEIRVSGEAWFWSQPMRRAIRELNLTSTNLLVYLPVCWLYQLYGYGFQLGPVIWMWLVASWAKAINAGVTCAKAAMYLRYVLEELDALQEGPTPLYINNEAAIAMINKTGQLRTPGMLKIQHFAIPRKSLLFDTPRITNPSTDMTKVLGSPIDSVSPVCPPILEQRPSVGHGEFNVRGWRSSSIKQLNGNSWWQIPTQDSIDLCLTS